MLALGGDAAPAATKVSFGQVSATATLWPGIVATKKGFFAANGVEMDTVSIGVSPGMQAVAAGSLNIMHNTCNVPVSFIESGGSGAHLSLVSMGIHPGVVVGKKGLKSGERARGQGGRHLVGEVRLDHPAAAVAEGARARSVRLRRGRRPG